MKAIRRLIFLSCVLLAVPAAYAGGPDVPGGVSRGSFDRIHVQGPLNVVIEGTQRPGTPSFVSSISKGAGHVRVAHHTLYLSSSRAGVGHRPVVVVRVSHLEGLTVRGAANVTGEHIQSSGLTLRSLGSGKIKLLGVLNVDHIEQAGSGQIELRWVNSDVIYVNGAGAGSIRLGGIAKIMYARMLGNSTLHAAYLRTGYVQVQVRNAAVAYVCPVDTLRAFASGRATVYYYKYPKNITRDSSQSGNVLQMAWHD